MNTFKALIESDGALNRIYVRGELSNYKGLSVPGTTTSR